MVVAVAAAVVTSHAYMSREESLAADVKHGLRCSGDVNRPADQRRLESTSSCTPSLEPMTVFLGGSGLAALVYASRRRWSARHAGA
jgi:hypothetical protein